MAVVNNIVDIKNSSNVPLPAFGEFLGDWTPVSGYASITINVNTTVPSLLSGVMIEWSTDAVTVDQIQPFTFDGPIFWGGGYSNGESWHAAVRMTYFRVRYKNWFTAQPYFHLQTLLRKEPPTGTIQRVAPGEALFTNTLDGETTIATLTAQDYYNEQFVLPFAHTNLPGQNGVRGGYLITDLPIATPDNHHIKIMASTTVVRIDTSTYTAQRKWANVLNDTIRGILLLKLGDDFSTPGTSGLTPTSYDFKVPPGHTWSLPLSHGMSSSFIYGLWDRTDGAAFYTDGRT